MAASHSESEPDWVLCPAQKVSEGLLGTITEPRALTEHSSDATGHRRDMVPVAIGMSIITASLSAPSWLQAGSQRPGTLGFIAGMLENQPSPANKGRSHLSA